MSETSLNVGAIAPRVTTKVTVDEDGKIITEKIEVVETDESIMTKKTTVTEEVNNKIVDVKPHKEKLQAALSGETNLKPTDNGLSNAEKTPEQEANLAKLANARQFLQTESGEKLVKTLADNGSLTRKEMKELKKAGIDVDAFLQVAGKSKYDAVKANEKLDDMGALANAFIGEDTEELPQNRQSVRKDGVRNEDERSFVDKVFGQKEKQNVKDSKKYAEHGGTKVNIHSSQDNVRKAEFAHDISDDVAKVGNEFLDAYADGYDGKRRQKFSEIDENGNVVKTKTKFRKDGSVKKVVVKSDKNGKILVKEAKDGHITVRGDLQSDNIMKDGGREVVYDTKITEKVETTIEKKEKPAPPTPPEPPTPPVPPTPPTPPAPPEPDPVPPPKKVEEPRGLIMDFVNDDNSSGFGNVYGATVREQYEAYGAEALANGYCSYKPENMPAQAKKLWPGNNATRVNSYNAEKITQSFIHDIDDNTNPHINEKAIGEMIVAFRNQGNDVALSGVKRAILRHNKVVSKMAEDRRGYDPGSRSVNNFITAKEVAIAWLMQQQDL